MRLLTLFFLSMALLTTAWAQDSLNVTRIGQLNLLSGAEQEGLTVVGSYAYVTNGSHGLRVIDISNPAAPAEMGFCDTPGYAGAVAVAGNYAYVADGFSGLRIIDISNPAAPVEAGFHA